MNIMVPSSLSEPYTKLNYNDGLLYCSLLISDGYDDWMLPTGKDLHIVLKNRGSSGLYWTRATKKDNDKIASANMGIVYSNYTPHLQLEFFTTDMEFQIVPVRYDS